MSTARPTTGQPHAPAVQAIGRISAIDGLRGAFLVLMTITHVTVPGGSILKALHPDTVAFIDSATGFVFLSGLMAGLVYARAADKHGYDAAARRMGVRAVQLYGYALALVGLIATASAVLPAAAAAWQDWAGPLTHPDVRSLGAAALLLQEASFADVLPMYAFFLLMGAGGLWMCLKGRSVELLATSVLVWAATQVGLTIPVTDALARAVVQMRPDLNLPDAFNLLGWQILFVAGLVAGAQTARGRIAWSAIFRPERTYLFWLSLVAAAMIAAAVLGFRLNHAGWAPESMAALFDHYTGKARLGIACLLNFAVFAYPVAWLLIAGPRAAGLLGRVAGLFGAAVNWPFLRLLGRHSLQVYAWQVVLVYALKLLDAHLGPSSPWLNAALIIACIALLAVPALARERWRRRPKMPSPPAARAEGARPTKDAEASVRAA